MTICTYNARTLASEAAIEDLMMQAKKIKYDVIGLTETRRYELKDEGWPDGRSYLKSGEKNGKGSSDKLFTAAYRRLFGVGAPTPFTFRLLTN
ncbi:hypothetical protein RB195_004884 [Necator americanus]|uniref:Endonuclease/exonuclease/phosphatase domain-containing protein n=1 Tax=Necator americanus TaxID=51031 RepID=A0ABR1BK63_NECAM